MSQVSPSDAILNELATKIKAKLPSNNQTPESDFILTKFSNTIKEAVKNLSNITNMEEPLAKDIILGFLISRDDLSAVRNELRTMQQTSSTAGGSKRRHKRKNTHKRSKRRSSYKRRTSKRL